MRDTLKWVPEVSLVLFITVSLHSYCDVSAKVLRDPASDRELTQPRNRHFA